MSMNRETGKDRWKRVPKDYFKKPDALQRTKFRFSVLAFLAVLIWCGLGINWSDRSGGSISGLDLRANHGPLASVHSAWDNKCDACHLPFEPIDGRPLLASSSSEAYRTSDKLCMSCHAGPAHHDAIPAADVRSCAECHRDHQGREASLVKLEDVECTRCHESLKDHGKTKDLKEEDRYQITRFDLKHPPFRPDTAALASDKKTLQDRGGLKFNHALHMTPGMVKKKGDNPFLINNAPAVLDCSSCHVLEASDLNAKPNPAVAAPPLPVRSDGKYFQPVNYETQCRACHDLNFDPRSPTIRAPHGVQPELVVEFLRRTYAARLLDENGGLPEKFVPRTGLPGKSPVEPNARKDFGEAVLKAQQMLFGTGTLGESKQSCHECHETVKDDKNPVPRPIAPTRVPTVWFTHAAFDHSAHRGVSCRECHAQSYAFKEDGVSLVENASTKGADVNLPDIENCRKCHAPAGRNGGWLLGSSSTSTGGVSHGCTECHTYHNGDHALEGIGAKAEHATSERKIEQFLLGKGETSARAQRGRSAKP